MLALAFMVAQSAWQMIELYECHELPVHSIMLFSCKKVTHSTGIHCYYAVFDISNIACYHLWIMIDSKKHLIEIL